MGLGQQFTNFMRGEITYADISDAQKIKQNNKEFARIGLTKPGVILQKNNPSVNFNKNQIRPVGEVPLKIIGDNLVIPFIKLAIVLYGINYILSK